MRRSIATHPRANSTTRGSSTEAEDLHGSFQLKLRGTIAGPGENLASDKYSDSRVLDDFQMRSLVTGVWEGSAAARSDKEIRTQMNTESDLSATGRTRSCACPAFFVRNVITAKASRHGYAEAGFHLAIHMREIIEGEVDAFVVADLEDALRDHPEQLHRIWSWMNRTLPCCMKLVPARRKDSFLRGVERALEEGRV